MNENTWRKEYLSFWKQEDNDYHFFLRPASIRDITELPYIADGVDALEAQIPHSFFSAQQALNSLPKHLFSGYSVPQYDGSALYTIPTDLKLDRVTCNQILRPVDLDWLQRAGWATSLYNAFEGIWIPETEDYSDIPDSISNCDKFLSGGGAGGGAGASAGWTPIGTFFTPKLSTFGDIWEYEALRMSTPTNYTYFALEYSWLYDNCSINPDYHIVGAWDTRSGAYGDTPSYYRLGNWDITCCNAGEYKGFVSRHASYTTIYVLEVLVSESSTPGWFYPSRDAIGGAGGFPSAIPQIIGGFSGGGGASMDWDVEKWLGSIIDVGFDAYEIWLGDYLQICCGDSPLYLPIIT